MANMYCTSCGGKIQYAVSRPKFCSECGEAVASVGVVAAKKVKEPLGREEGEEEVFEKPLNLQYEISASESPNVTLGGVVGTNKGGAIERRSVPNKKSTDPLGDAINDCKSARERR